MGRRPVRWRHPPELEHGWSPLAGLVCSARSQPGRRARVGQQGIQRGAAMFASRRRFAGLVVGLALALVLPGFASANHSWGGYHWARQANPFTLKLGDNVTSQWDSILGTTSSDWSQSTVLDTTIVAGSANP